MNVDWSSWFAIAALLIAASNMFVVGGDEWNWYQRIPWARHYPHAAFWLFIVGAWVLGGLIERV